MKEGTTIIESLVAMEVSDAPIDVRGQLIDKYGREEFQQVMRDSVIPGLTPAKKAVMAAMRVVARNPDSVADIKVSLQDYVNTL